MCAASAAKKKELSEKQLLEPRYRAEDILLGALGFSEDARIISIKKLGAGFSGTGTYSDGDIFDFASEETLSKLESWALETLLKFEDLKAKL